MTNDPAVSLHRQHYNFNWQTSSAVSKIGLSNHLTAWRTIRAISYKVPAGLDW